MGKTINIGIVAVIAVVGSYFIFANSSDNDKPVTEPETTEKSSAQSDQREVKIIAFGDSLTAGYDLPQSESYPAQLETKLKANDLLVEVVNAGVNGETTRGNLERAEFIRRQNSDIVILGIGGNDVLRQLPLEETKKNMDQTIEILRSGEDPPEVILLQMQAPLNSGLQYKLDFDSIYEDLADKYDLILVPFITLEVFSDQNNKLSDGVHLNEQGYEAIIDLYLYEPVKELVEEVRNE